jgi:UDP-glucose 4-epimerase
MARVLLTGADGFIGACLVQTLTQAGHEFRTCSLASGPDIRDRAAVADWVGRKQADVVVHAAAVSGQMMVGDDIAAVFDINVGGTINLLEALRLRGPSHLVHLSSNAVYQPRDDTEPVKEDAALGCSEPYGASKVAAELVVETYAKRFGLTATALRISSVYGPTRKTPYLFSEFTRAVQAGRPALVTGDGSNMRQFVHIDDVCRAVAVAIARPSPGFCAINIAGIERASELAIAKLVQQHLPNLEIAIVAEKGLPADNAIGPLSLNRARQLLGWEPRTSLKQGIATLFQKTRTAPAT